MEGRTTIIVAHRLSTIALADEIVVLENGPRSRPAARMTSWSRRARVYAEICDTGWSTARSSRLDEARREKAAERAAAPGRPEGGSRERVREPRRPPRRRSSGLGARGTLLRLDRSGPTTAVPAPLGRVTLILAATAIALAWPLAAKFAIDRGIVAGRPGHSRSGSPSSSSPRCSAGSRVVQTYLSAGSASAPRRPAPRPLRPHPEARARLLRAKPRRLADLAPDERRRGARSARHRRPLRERPEHAARCSARRRAVLPRLAPRARDAHGLPADGARDGALPVYSAAPIGARAPPRRGDRDAAGGSLGRARRPGVPPRAAPTPSTSSRSTATIASPTSTTVNAWRLLPVRRPAPALGHGDRARLRRHPVLRRRLTPGALFAFIALPVELLRPDAAALAALQHVPGGERGARQDLRRDGHRAAAARRARRARLPPIEGAVELDDVHFGYGGGPPRCCTASTSRSPPGRPSRSSGTRERASRRS